MKSSHIDKMFKGWFVGNFEPTAFATENCEVAVKSYKSGERESAHYHKIATEITLILSGRVRMMGREWGAGDIIILSPGEVTEFEAITDSINIVVKTPGAGKDKYTVDTSC